MIKNGIGTELKKLRSQRKLTQEALAHNADVAIAFIKEIEAGIKQPSVTTLFKLSYALGVSPSELVEPTYLRWVDQKD